MVHFFQSRDPIVEQVSVYMLTLEFFFCCLNFEHTILESNNDKNDTNIAVCDDNDKKFWDFTDFFRTISSGWIKVAFF